MVRFQDGNGLQYGLDVVLNSVTGQTKQPHFLSLVLTFHLSSLGGETPQKKLDGPKMAALFGRKNHYLCFFTT